MSGLEASLIGRLNIGPMSLNCECCKTSDKMWFCKTKGFIPSFIDTLISRKERIHGIIDDSKPLLMARLKVIGLIIENIGDYYRNPNSRWYSSESFNALQLLVKAYINKLLARLNEDNIKTVYADKQNLLVQCDDPEQSPKFKEALVQRITGIELTFSNEYNSALMISSRDEDNIMSKKKLAMLSTKGLVLRGFKSEFYSLSNAASFALKKCLEFLLKEQSLQSSIELVREVVSKIKKKELPLESYAISTLLLREPKDYDSKSMQYSAALRMKNMGMLIQKGSKVSYVIVEGDELLHSRIRLLNEAKENQIDSDYYVNTQLMPVVEKVFRVFGLSNYDILEEKDQSKLEKFIT